MGRFLKIAIPVFLVGFVAGNAFWYLASPLWIDDVVSEALPDELMVQEVARGQFRDADRSHQGTGIAQILETGGGAKLLRLTEFQVTNGPDLEVWLSAHPDPVRSADVAGAAWLSLGQLKGNIGDQTYIIPDDADLSAYQSVVIWCEQFGVLFSPAALTGG
ncbi:hypothetical protein FHS89_002915 [Rubricella aquisinus]|uniref:DM13 domain-containing protein n=1 Tax=Rubricella aquisinus TaxID=2028108 RepID=A0A840WQ97_9RHOB|nr:DM13 domain-containing protein [Rubricella aquisinus]MBB5516871.1 hypothetical protein [Rubricella aquisinus]